MGNPVPKQLLELQSKPILVHTLERFEFCASVQDICVIVPEDRVSEVRRLVRQWKIRKAGPIVPGGRERTDSVQLGLSALNKNTDIVLIHDAVRPFVPVKMIVNVIRAAAEYGAAILAVPALATVKHAENGVIQRTLDRDAIWLAQTPQGFRFDLIRKAYDAALKQGIKATDDAALVEQLGHPVRIIPGHETNIKITTPADLAIAETLCRQKAVKP